MAKTGFRSILKYDNHTAHAWNICLGSIDTDYDDLKLQLEKCTNKILSCEAKENIEIYIIIVNLRKELS